ncbi:DNA-binding protein [Rubrivivax gelatinosus]|uniref:DNA-binding protein n=1 Tax=Rubrivivax gelatinosus TaxID=28068 RepID=UPI0002F3D3E3|nr:DNA-binding protein [Rubrivivax gelatinosus]MBG6083191.1 chromosome segregation ATPase [Rubrivivax gelatinosus]
MVKKVVTQEIVSAAANALVAEGKEPTFRLIQERTGGSYTTIKPYLEAWDAERRKAPAVELPLDVQAQGKEFVQRLYAHALRAATESVAEPLARAEAARAKAKEQLANVEGEVARLEAVEQAQAAQIDALSSKLHDLELTAAAQQATLQEKAAAVARLEAQLEQAQRDLAGRDQELAALRASSSAVSGLQSQLEQLQRTVQDLASGDSAAKGG